MRVVQVLRIKVDANSRPIEIEEIYANDGTELSGSTVAVVHGNKLLIGSVLTHAVLCEIK
jgi:arylesterase / paraoxonase